MDARSDIFSFGSVLYEMVTGQRAFQGDSKMSTLAAVLNQEPKPASEISRALPHDLEKIITRCLRKDPSRRFQGMADLKVALEELKEEFDSGVLAAGRSRELPESPAASHDLGGWRWAWWVLRWPPPRGSGCAARTRSTRQFTHSSAAHQLSRLGILTQFFPGWQPGRVCLVEDRARRGCRHLHQADWR